MEAIWGTLFSLPLFSLPLFSLLVIALPIWPFFALAALCVHACKPFGIEPPLHRRRVAFYTKDRAFDTRKIREKLGFQPRTNEEGLVQTATWYRENGWVQV